MIGSLGRTAAEDKLTIYIKQDGDANKEAAVPASPAMRRKFTPAVDSEASDAATETSASSRLLSRYRHPVEVSNDLLKTIEEVDKEKQHGPQAEETYDGSPAPLAATASGASESRDKKRYQRTMTPNTLRSKLQEKLMNSFDTSELAGTIASIGGPVSPKPDAKGADDAPAAAETDVSLPPSGPRRTRRLSRGTLGEGGEGPIDKIEIDSENIETPPVTRRAYGSRPFRSSRDDAESSVGVATTATTAAPAVATTAADTTEKVKTEKTPEDDELGDGRFDRYSSSRRTRRFRKAPEGAEEDASNLEPRKSPEGVEDFAERPHVQPDGVIVGMEVKKVR